MPNTLFYGDNLDVLRKHVRDESVDLIYLDPPFNSRRDYNVIFKEADGAAPAAQIRAFDDTWQYTQETARVKEEINEVAPAYGCPKLPQMVQGFVDVLGHNDLTAYLMMMAIRLLELKRALKPTGSIYFHCDPTMGHYIKVMMDIIFGAKNFINEITWKRTNVHSHAAQGTKHFSRVQDTILFYGRSSDRTWHQLYVEHTPEHIAKSYRHVEEGTGRRYSLGDLTVTDGEAKGNPRFEFLGVTRYWRYNKEKMEELSRQGHIVQTHPGTVPRQKRYLDESLGTEVSSVWADILPISSHAAERLGYPTQKPEALLERIIKASSNESDVVMDPFAGCGTTISVAQRLKRQWMGIDITHLAIALLKKRLADQFDLKARQDYQVIGEPADVASAAELARTDPYQFQWWALSLIPAHPAGDGKKKGADRGMDGLLYFVDGADRKNQQIIVQVKGGHVNVKDIRELAHVVEREKAAMGFFICLEDPTQPMLTEAAGVGFYKSELWQGDFPRLQIRTVAELLAGRNFDFPKHASTTFRRAVRAQAEAGQETLRL